MPYRLTRHPPPADADRGPSVTAAPHLTAARQLAGEQIAQCSYRADDFANAHWGELEQAACDLDAAGATIGPLPDGSTVEVRPVTWSQLTSEAEISPWRLGFDP